MARAARHRPQAPPRKPERRLGPLRGRWGLALLGILLLTFAAYIPSLGNGYVNWDDNYYVTLNPLVSHPTLGGILTTQVAANWHPLTIASLALNYRISGFDPASYHWLNLLLHLANTALVFFFVRALSRGRFWTTVVTALFFGIHPLHVESVAWIAERKDVLYAFFYLIALIAYLRYVDERRLSWLVAAFAAALLSVASKPAAVVLPLTMLAVDYLRRRPLRPGLLLEKVPFLALAAAGGFVTLSVQRSQGALQSPLSWSLLERAMFAAYGTVQYVGKMLVPVGLSAIYPYPPGGAGHALPPSYPLSLAALAVALPALVIVFRRNRPVLFGVAFFFINIALVLQFATVGTAVMAERYTYLPYVGLFFALSWWLDERPSGSRKRAWIAALAGYFILLAPFSLAETWKRCDVWHDPETFWTDAIQKHPGRIVAAYTNRGNYYRRTGRLEEARRDYAQALALNPRIAANWYNQAVVLARLGSEDSALVSLGRAIELEPGSVRAWNDRGAIRYRRGDLAGAVADFSRAIELDPTSWNAYANRALAYAAMGDHEKALDDRRRAIQVDPANRANAGVLELMAGDSLAAERHLRARPR